MFREGYEPIDEGIVLEKVQKNKIRDEILVSLHLQTGVNDH